jgi:hypothetical protein
MYEEVITSLKKTMRNPQSAYIKPNSDQFINILSILERLNCDCTGHQAITIPKPVGCLQRLVEWTVRDNPGY